MILLVELPGIHIDCVHCFIAELKRYFEAAEEAAKEILLEEIKPKLVAGSLQPYAGDQELLEQLQVTRSAEVNENDGVFQLTTIGSLPLKSPKRMVALQLANSNPAFRCVVFHPVS